MKRKLSFSINIDAGQTIEYLFEADGLFMYKDNMSAAASIEAFINDFHHAVHDFNECYGAYRAKITYKNEIVYFADNSGMMRYCINRNNQSFHSSIDEAEKEKKNRVPNFQAIAQFLNYGCTYNNETVIQSVILSDPNVYYVYKDNQLTKHSKGLKGFSDYKEEAISLKRFISQAVAHCEGKIGCTITGGIDSRSVLANLINLGIKPHLYITGHETQSDVQIAKEIADATNLSLTVVSDDIEDENWLAHSVDAADGQEGICGIYRLDKLARQLNKDGIELQFGGVNGEMYKNSFINQDFPVYFGKPKWDRFYKLKVGTFDLERSMFTKKLWNEVERLPSIITEWLQNHEGHNKADAYLNAGYEIMQARCNRVINMFGRFTTIYNPLMERKMASFAYGKNPYTLEMQAFQRREVSDLCQEIKGIRTDRDLTCDYNRRFVEFFKSYLFLLKVAANRVVFRKKVDIRIDKCFEIGHKDKNFFIAMDDVKRIDVIDRDARVDQVPIGLADRLFTIGILF